MKKIAFVTNFYSDSDFSIGGAKLNYMLLSELSKRGYAIEVFSKFWGTCNHRNFLMSPVIDNMNIEQETIILSDDGYIPSDITYIHGHSYKFRQKMMRKNFLEEFLYKIFDRKKHLKRLNEHILTKENLKKSKYVVVSSNVLKQDVIENYEINPDNVVIIPPPIEKYNAEINDNEIFTFGISATGFVRKGGYITLRAIKELKKQGYNFKVRFIYHSRNKMVSFWLKAYGIEDYCEFVPVQNNIGEFYNKIDCLLVPSIIEPFGMVGSEALSVGKPVITGSHCGVADFITDGKNGYTYDFSNHSIKGLVETMKMMLSKTKTELYQMSEYSKDSAKNHSIKDFADEYIKLIENLKK